PRRDRDSYRLLEELDLRVVVIRAGTGVHRDTDAGDVVGPGDIGFVQRGRRKRRRRQRAGSPDVADRSAVVVREVEVPAAHRVRAADGDELVRQQVAGYSRDRGSEFVSHVRAGGRGARQQTRDVLGLVDQLA